MQRERVPGRNEGQGANKDECPEDAKEVTTGDGDRGVSRILDRGESNEESEPGTSVSRLRSR